MGFAHTTTREENDVRLADQDFPFDWGMNIVKEIWTASPEMIVHGAPAEGTMLTRR